MNDMRPIQTIGVPQPLVDGPEKATGKAMFAADFDAAEALVGRILRCPVAHANIISMDTTAAEALSGVMAVVTEADCADSYGVLPIAMNEWALARGRVRYKGEPVAAVAAVDVATAQAAIDLIQFKYKELPAYYTSEDAMADGAIELHEHRPGNIEREVNFELGDVDAGMGEADLVMERNYNCAEVCQVQS